MKVINNGKGLRIEADYTESAILTEALRKSILQYERENAPEYAKQVRDLLNELMNKQIVEIKYSSKKK